MTERLEKEIEGERGASVLRIIQAHSEMALT